ncbi:unnamed protein product, partial [Choristocarpus tenellus]
GGGGRKGSVQSLGRGNHRKEHEKKRMLKQNGKVKGRKAKAKSRATTKAMVGEGKGHDAGTKKARPGMMSTHHRYREQDENRSNLDVGGDGTGGSRSGGSKVDGNLRVTTKGQEGEDADEKSLQLLQDKAFRPIEGSCEGQGAWGSHPVGPQEGLQNDGGFSGRDGGLVVVSSPCLERQPTSERKNDRSPTPSRRSPRSKETPSPRPSMDLAEAAGVMISSFPAEGKM